MFHYQVTQAICTLFSFFAFIFYFLVIQLVYLQSQVTAWCDLSLSELVEAPAPAPGPSSDSVIVHDPLPLENITPECQVDVTYISYVFGALCISVVYCLAVLMLFCFHSLELFYGCIHNIFASLVLLQPS